MNIYAISRVGLTISELDPSGVEIRFATSTGDFGSHGGFPGNITVGPDGRIYYFGSQQVGEGYFWVSHAPDLSSWSPGPLPDFSGVTGVDLDPMIATSGVFIGAALYVVMSNFSGEGTPNALLRFPDPSSGVCELVASWLSVSAWQEQGATSDGKDVYDYTYTTGVVRRISMDGTVTEVLNSADYQVCSPVPLPGGGVLAFGASTAHLALIRSSPTDPTDISVVRSWTHAAEPTLPFGLEGSGLLTGGFYYFSGNANGAIGRYALNGSSFGQWTAIGNRAILATRASVGRLVIPPLRYYPRDDAVGGSPRTDRSSTSRQSTARQGWTNTYR